MFTYSFHIPAVSHWTDCVEGVHGPRWMNIFLYHTYHISTLTWRYKFAYLADVYLKTLIIYNISPGFATLGFKRENVKMVMHLFFCTLSRIKCVIIAKRHKPSTSWLSTCDANTARRSVFVSLTCVFHSSRLVSASKHSHLFTAVSTKTYWTLRIKNSSRIFNILYETY